MCVILKHQYLCKEPQEQWYGYCVLYYAFTRPILQDYSVSLEDILMYCTQVVYVISERIDSHLEI